MLPNRIHISARATDLLKQVKTRTGVTPNILCRIALMLSLEEKHQADTNITDLNGQEFNLTTLFGETAELYQSALRQAHGNASAKEAQLLFAAHIDHGVDKLRHVRSLSDLLKLQPK
ncbi:DNA sulfur modification protein DndE [Methylobacillus gramineus]|uniref:DNA sulfur modification protein DndE n=1 Tax=Methylobacillus gramineus TaxID=755169 RepID=UPI001CFF85E9|nr:DNA sulfur modification protein DndE [Methylobacillus gramineus]MCB5186145.1 DNA sulfur modification protein DndE [Methylobacillus gramineus]